MMYNADSNATVDDIQAAMRRLSSLDNRQLRELVESDSKVVEYLSNIDLSTRKTLVGQKEMIMAQNKSLAEYNLTFEPMLQEGRNNLKMLVEQIESVKSSIQKKADEIMEKGGAISSETALALLQTAAAESEEESEKLAEMFNQREVEVDDFLEKFTETRKRMHLRKVKVEKMMELVSQKSSRPVSGPRRAAPLPPYPVNNNPFFHNM